MDKFFRRKLNQKGFTIAELVVVIAIIGILLALILPTVFNGDKSTKGKTYAKSYFYAVQDIMAQRKVADNPAAPAFPAAELVFYTTTDSTGNVVESGVLPFGTTTMTPLSSILANTSLSEEYKQLVQKYATAMEKTITSTEFEGTFYALVDDNYVVHVAYWSDGLMSDLVAGNPNLKFSDDYVVSGYTCCSYPVELSTVAGGGTKEMFKYN